MDIFSSFSDSDFSCRSRENSYWAFRVIVLEGQEVGGGVVTAHCDITKGTFPYIHFSTQSTKAERKGL